MALRGVRFEPPSQSSQQQEACAATTTAVAEPAPPPPKETTVTVTTVAALVPSSVPPLVDAEDANVSPRGRTPMPHELADVEETRVESLERAWVSNFTKLETLWKRCRAVPFGYRGLTC